MEEMTVALVIAVATSIIGAMLAWIRWSVVTTIDARVNGKVDDVQETVNEIKDWTESHDRRHGYERRQLIAALERNDLDPPDGWRSP